MKPKYNTFTGIKAEDIPAKLAERFPPGAYKGVPGGADLTDINTGYMIERISEVFGPKGLGWNLLYNPADLVSGGESGRTVTRLSATFLYCLWDEAGARVDCAFPVSGISQNDFKYADEGARTSATGAAIKWLCFQKEVYKGQFDHHDAESEKRAAGKVGAPAQATTTTSAAGANGNGANGNGSTKPPAKPAAPAPADDAEPAPASWTGIAKYSELAERARKMGIVAESVVPLKDTKGKVRAMYAQLAERVVVATPTPDA